VSNSTLSPAALRTAMTDPEHLKRWLIESGRPFLIFLAQDLVDALPFPEGLQALAGIRDSYREHRRKIATGDTETQTYHDDVVGDDVEVEVALYKDDTLELAEIDRAIRYLVGLATEKDPSWSLSNPPR
jgi:hypothetical protein